MAGTPEKTVSGVLEDESGRRARWLRRAGRVVFVVFLAWLLVIVLGGLGLTPIAGIPLTHVLRPSPGPPPVAKLPKPRPPSASDLRPAIPAAAFARAKTTTVHGKSSLAPGQTKTTTSPGRSGSAPGRTKTTTTTRARGKSTTSKGHTRTATTTTATTTTTRRSKKP